MLLPRSLLLKPLIIVLNPQLSQTLLWVLDDSLSRFLHSPCKKKPPPSLRQPRRTWLALASASPCVHPPAPTLKGFFSLLLGPDSTCAWLLPCVVTLIWDLLPMRWPGGLLIRVGQGLAHPHKHQRTKSKSPNLQTAARSSSGWV